MRGVWSLDIPVFIRWFELLSKRYNDKLEIQDREGADSQMPHFIIVRVFIWGRLFDRKWSICGHEVVSNVIHTSRIIESNGMHSSSRELA
jgi:hypothetical protein